MRWREDDQVSTPTYTDNSKSAPDQPASLPDRANHAISQPLRLAAEQQRFPVSAKSLTDAAVRETQQTLDLLELDLASRILIIEPFAHTIGHQLRLAGFRGEIVALLQRPLETYAPLRHQDIYSQIAVYDWPDALQDGQNSQTNPISELGKFQVVLALELTRVVPAKQMAQVLRWATTMLAPQGYLIVGEPLTSPSVKALEQKMLQSNLLLAADERIVDADWQWSLTRWQLRPGDSSRLTGQLSEVTLPDLQRHSSLRYALVASYREVFGGEEWGEWMRCPACNRHYSRKEYEQLQPPDQCGCGTSQALEIYHPAEEVLAQLQHDLIDPRNSHLYTRRGTTGNVEAFIWGYLASPAQLLQDVLPTYGVREQEKLYQALLDQLNKAGISDVATPIYHQAFIGALDHVRSLSLVRSLFVRMCQFALDQGTEVVITATIPTVNAYPLLRGIGMEPIYTFPQTLSPEHSTEYTSHLDKMGVILGGRVRSLLSLMTQDSDRALVVRVARYMKQLKEASREAIRY